MVDCETAAEVEDLGFEIRLIDHAAPWLLWSQGTLFSFASCEDCGFLAAERPADGPQWADPLPSVCAHCGWGGAPS